MNYPIIQLSRGKEESLRRFHPWVFSGAIHSMDQSIEEGDTVSVIAADGSPLGVGHYQVGSIAVRMLSDKDIKIDSEFYCSRLLQAARLRKSLGLMRPDNNAFRLVHGEGDFLPGLIIDVYGSTAVLQAHSAGMHYARQIIAQALTELPDMGIKNVYYKSETTLPYKAALDPQNDYIIGGIDTDVAIENSLKFHVDWLKGQKTGFFVDQRDNRSLLGSFAKGRKVLNMFCYTGGFSVYALKGGAELVHSVDSSAKAVALVNANVELNFGPDAPHEAFAVDAFKYLSEMEDGAYDLVILDPPAFAKHRGAIRNALRGYQRLNAKAMEKMPSGSILFTFSCSQAISKEQFRLAVFSAAAQTGRRVRIIHQLTQPVDHPVNIYHPEGEYLKGLVLYIE